jgi:uncharacterized membrane protein YeaQ/YmgE (transglycosylase-associated protein family)
LYPSEQHRRPIAGKPHDYRDHAAGKMINILIWMVAGADQLASIIMRTNSRQGLIADIIVGIVGAFVGGYLLSPLFNTGTINQGDFSLPALLVSLGGAVILLASPSCSGTWADSSLCCCLRGRFTTTTAGSLQPRRRTARASRRFVPASTSWGRPCRFGLSPKWRRQHSPGARCARGVLTVR